MGLPRHCFNWAFLREFSAPVLKKENIEDKNKVVAVGHRLQERGVQGIQEEEEEGEGGVKMICRPVLLSDHLKCE